MSKKINKISLLKFQLTVGLFLLLVLSVSGFFIFSPWSFENVALALSGNYSKNTGDSFTAAEWNNLRNDFLDKTAAGDTMTGVLTMGANINMNNHQITGLPANPVGNTDAASKGYVDTQLTGRLSNLIQGPGGQASRIKCGETFPLWVQFPLGSTAGSTRRLYAIVNTSTGFASNPIYMSMLHGTAQHYMTYGAGNIYANTPDSFDIYITYEQTISPAQANTWGWHIDWCAFGN